MFFSRRFGFIPPKAVQLEDLDDETRSSLWNVTIMEFSLQSHGYVIDEPDLKRLADVTYFSFFKKPLDSIPSYSQDFIEELRKVFLDEKWFKILDFIEFLCEQLPDWRLTRYSSRCNLVLERERSAYRILDQKVIQITSDEELREVESAYHHVEPFGPSSKHIKQAIRLYADRKAPDYRNSIKESISAVEAAARIIANDEKANLEAALRSIQKSHSLHPAFKAGISKIYGYTSDDGGIRHALTDSATDVDEVDARYMLISCSAFVNYLISRFGVPKE